MLTLQNFRAELWNTRQAYRDKNPWVAGWSQWDNDGLMWNYIDAAYKLYAQTAGNALRLVILGDTEIRSMEELMLNFGLMSGGGVQEQADKTKLKDADAKRKQVAMGTEEGLAGKVSVLGPGSILSDDKWTPILNDALMLGSIECGCGFYLGLNSVERAAWIAGGFDADAFGIASSGNFGGAVAPAGDRFRSKWLTFMRQQPQILWRGGVPRVFARELIALKTFGYLPIFSKLGLAFEPPAVPPAEAVTFSNYIEKLNTLRFHENDKPRVMGAISEFLFNDATALTY